MPSSARRCIAIAVLGWGASLFVPQRPRRRARAPDQSEHRWSRPGRSCAMRIASRRCACRSLASPGSGSSGIAYLAQFPNYAKAMLGANNEVVTLFLTLFSIGIGAGSLLCGRLQRGEINARLVPLGALGLTVFGFDLYLASRGAAVQGPLSARSRSSRGRALAHRRRSRRHRAGGRDLLRAALRDRCRRAAIRRTARASSPPTTS